MRRALAVLVLLAGVLPASADLFIVRHAEKKSPKMDKSTLSPAGLKRAKTLAKVLADVPLKAVYVTEYERTRQTAAPSAAAHALTPIQTASEDVKGLAASLKGLPESDDVLVVGHSDTIPDLLVELGVSTRAVIGAADFDNLWVVSRRGAAPVLHRLHY